MFLVIEVFSVDCLIGEQQNVSVENKDKVFKKITREFQSTVQREN